MPKDGYTSVTIALWQLEAAALLFTPGQTFQGFFLNSVLAPRISKKQLQEIYDNWCKKYQSGSEPTDIFQERKNV